MADLPAFWHPFSDMSRVIGHEVELDHGDGVWLTDARGRRYLDGTAGLWFANVGHGRAEIADAAAAQMKKLVRETRTAGLLGAIELRGDVEPSRPRAIELLVERLRERGILVRGLVGHSIQISPPFVITVDELGVLFSGIEEQLDAMNQSIAVGAVRV